MVALALLMKPGFQYISRVSTAMGPAVMMIYGLNLPFFSVCRSTMIPISGSLIASHTLATAKITEQAIAGMKITL